MARLSLALVAAALALTTAAGFSSDDFVNTQVTRKVDATKHVVVSTTAVTVTGKGGSKYYLAFTEEEAAHLASVEVTDGGKDKSEKFAVVKDDSINRPGFVHYVAKLKKAIGAEPVQIRVIAVFTGMLTPLPAEVSQGDAQLVVLPLNTRFTTPYATRSQSTTVHLSSSRVEDYTKAQPASVDKTKVKYGPYMDAEGYASVPGRVHYENGTPFGTVDWAVREVEVSLWGNVAVEEHIEMRHTGAKLKHGFSRIDYTARRQQGASFNALTAVLPAGASDVYYRDVIGNISTSAVRHEPTRTVMEIAPRFPLFGGWKTNWYQGYNVPAGQHLTTNADGSLTLTFDAHLPYAGFPVNDYKLRVILPEAAAIVSTEAPFPHTLDTKGRRYTFLDGPFYGRPIATFTATGPVVPGVTHSGKVSVTFTVPPFAHWYKAGYLVAAFAIAFAVLLVASRVSTAIVTGSKADKAAKAASVATAAGN